jgi:superfamily II DNA helicase RecQ
MFVRNYKKIVRRIFHGNEFIYGDILGIKAGCYHAGLSALARTHVHEKWIKNQIHVICATIAFG